ncbi:hypothetical protein LCGC14_0080850 [marine sediment metagenome]|uniref:Tetratricopeptide repeat protein n=1 Tax=marine sediment metagenome TaxID=412755 RepID=A0A0F9YJT1_9ZZZZ|nr:hypothetical protein [Maribacter sp.]HDZ05024.1 hypothetical protein [Maribacter sp.]HEA80500.1 hypothetical protein [Maribacter sp.]
MNVKDFTYFLEHPTKVVEPIHTKHLEDIIAEYPYFQAARALHLKGLKNLNSYKYNKALKTTAAFTTDRDVLFDFITSKDFLHQNSTHSYVEEKEKIKDVAIINETEIEPKPDDIEVSNIIEEEVIEEDTATANVHLSTSKKEDTGAEPKFKEESIVTSLIPPFDDKPLPQDEHDADQILDPELFQSKDPANTEEENALDIGKPITFDAKEKYSFSEWLSLASKQPLEKPEKEKANVEDIERKEHLAEEVKEKVEEKKVVLKPVKIPRVKNDVIKKKYDRIDKFIASNPKIVPTEQQSISVDISKSSRIDNNELMTETLARVYLEQKKYKKAIQAFKILSLKYPEKSSFFANRIKAVEKLRKDNK